MGWTQSHQRARFATESCHQALTNLEVQYPVSFAIELQQFFEEKPTEAMAAMTGSPGNTRRYSFQSQPPAQPPTSARPGMAQASQTSSSRSLSSSVSGRSTDSQGKQKGRTADSENQSTTNISDEADSFRKLRRQTYYRECSRHFIRYFNDAGTRYVFDSDSTLTGKGKGKRGFV